MAKIRKGMIVMQTKVFKRITGSLLFTCALVSLIAAMAFSTPGVARASAPIGGCSVSTLQGLYVLGAHGWNIESQNRALPKAILDGIRFNGDGTFVTLFGTVSLNGVIFSGGGAPGTYTVNEDCTGTASFEGGNVIYNMFVRPGGGQIWMIQTSGPGGTRSVLEGMATRVP
jgi:hypothetical protein